MSKLFLRLHWSAENAITFVSVSNPELVSVTQYDVMFLLVPFLETHSEKGKVSLADLEMPTVLLNIINR